MYSIAFCGSVRNARMESSFGCLLQKWSGSVPTCLMADSHNIDAPTGKNLQQKIEQTLKHPESIGDLGWLPRRDSNPNKQNQNLRCYHYTTRQSRFDFPYWRGRRGSNPQPPDRQSSALTNCATTPCSRK